MKLIDKIEEYYDKKQWKKQIVGFDFDKFNETDLLPLTLKGKANLAETYMKIYDIMFTYEKDGQAVKDIVSQKIIKALEQDPSLVLISSNRALLRDPNAKEYWQHSLGTIALDKGYLDVVRCILGLEVKALNEPGPSSIKSPLHIQGMNLASHCVVEDHPELAAIVLDNHTYRTDNIILNGRAHLDATLVDALVNSLSFYCAGDDIVEESKTSRNILISVLNEAIRYEDVITRRDRFTGETLAHKIAKEYGTNINFDSTVRNMLDLEFASGKVRELTDSKGNNVMDTLLLVRSAAIEDYLRGKYDYSHDNYLENQKIRELDVISKRIDDILELDTDN